MNVVMIALEAARADHLSCYGYGRQTTPNLDRLVEDGVVFDNHFTPAVPTQPAFTTIFSGAHPLTHRIIAHEAPLNPNPKITWLPLLLRHHNYTTVAIDTLIDHRPWFARGFEYYVNPCRRGDLPDSDSVNQRAIEWLEHCRREPFFLHLHYWDGHLPYRPDNANRQLFYQGDPTTQNVGSLNRFYEQSAGCGAGYTWLEDLLKTWPTKVGSRIEDVDFLIAQYDAELRTADHGIGQICEMLKSLDLWPDTLVMVYGDHGVELGGEHGIYFDHYGLYDANLRVPLIMHWPEKLDGGRRVSAMSQQQDLLATVLDAIGADVSDLVEGRSLLPLARGTQTVSHWNHTLMACECTYQAKWALRTAEYKLIVSREPDFHGRPPVELYDLLDDPLELHNLATRNRPLVEKLLDKFDTTLKRMLEARHMKGDPIAPGRLSLGRQVFKQIGKPYPPRDPKWKGHVAPVIAGIP